MQTQITTHILFDKLAYSTLLQDSGFSTIQTDALANAQHEALRYLVDTHLVTKADLNHFRQETKADLDKLRHDFDKFRHETVIEVRDIRYAIERHVSRIDHLLSHTYYKAVLSLGGMIGIATAVIACIMKL